MKARSITARNVTGGFLGGILGILGFGYIHAFILPFGCILGVLIGWWYQEISQSAIEGWHKGMVKAHVAWDRIVPFLITPTRKLRTINIIPESLMKVVHFFVFLVAWVFCSPIAFYRWLGKHQMNQVYTIRFFAMVTTFGLTAAWMIPLGFKINQMFNGSAMEMLNAPIVILGVVVVMSPIIYSLNHAEEDLGSFYSSWSSYLRQGVILFFLKDVATIVLMQVALVIIFSGVGTWFLAMGGVFIIVIIAPLSFVIGMVKGIYKVAMKSGHWLCLITTLAVTSISALEMNAYFADARIIWAVALMTGVISAIATEGLRRLIAIFYERNEFIRRVAITTLGAQLTPSGKAFCRLSRVMGEKCIQPMLFAIR